MTDAAPRMGENTALRLRMEAQPATRAAYVDFCTLENTLKGVRNSHATNDRGRKMLNECIDICYVAQRRIVKAMDAPAAQEPVAWEFQHEETGRTTIQVNGGVNTLESYLKLSPRHFYVRPLYAAPVAAQAPADPLDTPLPCDITVGHVTIGKNCPLRALVHRMQALYSLSNGVLKIDREAIDAAIAKAKEGAAS